MKKRIPSKSSNYASLIDENAFYVDKTHFIKKLESISDKYLFFLRPRRFGKSLLLSMLEHYYGIQHKDRFNELFGEYFIGKSENTSPLRNGYYILHLDFSGINTHIENDILTSFNEKLKIGFSEFVSNYNIITTEELSEIISKTYPSEIIGAFLSAVQSGNKTAKIYLFIDEYDHFTNEIFSFNMKHFKEIVSTNGWVRKFYEVIKQFMGAGIIDRFFATGVTPVTLDSLTSGFNVAKNITVDSRFHTMAGFTENEVRELIKGTFREEGKLDLDTLISDIREWYNGSRFSVDTEEKLYNPQMLINFLDYFYAHGRYPVEMYDPSIASDYTKIKKQLSIISPTEAKEVVDEIIEKERIKQALTTQYNFEKRMTKTDLVSLLFYNGMLTVGTGDGKLIDYEIPNYVVKTMFWDFLRESYTEQNLEGFDYDRLIVILDEMRHEGTINKLVEHISRTIDTISNRDLQGFREAQLKMLLVATLSFSDIYKINSEFEVNRKYLDLYLKLQPNYKGRYSFLLELKYIKQSDSEKYEQIKKEGIEQVANYIKLSGLDQDKNLKAYLVLFLNSQAEVMEVVGRQNIEGLLPGN